MYDIIIIGAGLGGMTSALYALRNNKSVLILEDDVIGGQIANSPKVENFPTIQEISGSDLADKVLDQITKMGAELEFEKVVSVDKTDDIFTVTTEYGCYTSKSVICAVGVKHKHLGFLNEKKLLGKGVYYCALCDGPFYKNREVALIGDGNTAMQYALVLSNICSKVHLLTWFDKFFCDNALAKAVLQKENIVHLPNTSVEDFIGENLLEGIKYKEKITGKQKILNVPAVFVAIGQVPDNKAYEHLAELDKFGYFIPNENMETNTPGFFVAGDCRAKKVRQLATAVSDGAVAAISACSYIDQLSK